MATWRVFEAMTEREFQSQLLVALWIRFGVGFVLGLTAGWWVFG